MEGKDEVGCFTSLVGSWAIVMCSGGQCCFGRIVHFLRKYEIFTINSIPHKVYFQMWREVRFDL